MKPLLVIALLAAALPAQAASWKIDPARSSISFSGSHAGTAFTGSFRKWQGKIEFDPAKLAQSKAVIVIELSSATTGNKSYDGTLPQADWLNSAKVRDARFETTSIVADGKNYVARGTLTLRGLAVPVVLPFTLAITGKTARMQGKTILKRMAFGIGKSSDATGDWVSLDIPLSISVTATRP
jgi:polyisoprenoid-binding protein YceI